MGFEAQITIEILLQNICIQITNNPVGKVKAYNIGCYHGVFVTTYNNVT